jgi:hypothetical protein
MVFLTGFAGGFATAFQGLFPADLIFINLGRARRFNKPLSLREGLRRLLFGLVC